MRAILFTAGVLFSSVVANAAPNEVFYMQIPGISGEVTNGKYAGWIQVNAFSAGIVTATSVGGSGAGAGKPSCKPLIVIKPLDTTSPELARDAAVGTHLASVVLVAVSGTGGESREFLRFTLKSALISSVLFGGDTNVSSRTETATIAAEQLEITATPQRPDGSSGQTVSSTFNCSTNVAT